MRMHRIKNERIKREYVVYLERVKRMSPKSVDQVVAAIAAFEKSTNFKDFAKFHRNQAVAFQQQMRDSVNATTGRPLAKATIHSRLMAMKAFIQWLQGQPGFRSKIGYGDAEYFNTSANDERIAKAQREKRPPTLQQIQQTVGQMATETIVNRRDRAVMAFAVLSGARDDALASLLVGHVNITARTFYQDARAVRTKNAKTFASSFFPVDPMFEEIASSWVNELALAGYGPDDPLFPATRVAVGPDRRFAAAGLTKGSWKSANAIRRIFKTAFVAAGMPYFNPHSFRKTLAIHCEKLCKTAEQWKACSQNFGHSSPMTTYTSYGAVTAHRQVEIMNDLSYKAPALKNGFDAKDLTDEQIQSILSELGRRLATSN